MDIKKEDLRNILIDKCISDVSCEEAINEIFNLIDVFYCEYEIEEGDRCYNQCTDCNGHYKP